MDTVLADTIVMWGIVVGKWVASFIFGLFVRNALHEVRSALRRERESVQL